MTAVIGANAPVTSARIAQGVTGVVLTMALWELAGRLGWLGRTFPPLTATLEAALAENRRTAITGALASTSQSALTGLAIGVIGACLLAIAAVALPALRPGVDRLAAVVHAMPIIALAPLFIVTLGREQTAAAIGALGAGFAMFVAATSALHTAKPLDHDLFSVLGAGRWDRFAKLQLPAALPGLVDGLRLAAPAAVLGAVIGEWFGAPRGLGVLIVSAMQNFQIELLWAAALSASIMSMVAFGLLSLLARFVNLRWGAMA